MPYSTLKTELLQKHLTDIFIETGTANGEGVATALECGFKKIISIEVNVDIYAKASKRFMANEEVLLVLGDSGVVLPAVLGGVHEKATFWLDAHWSQGECDQGPGVDKCPILRDIAAISEHPVKNHIILIDDIRYFRAGGLPVWNNITLGDIMDQIMHVNPMYRIDFADGFMANDVLVATVKD